MRSVSNPNPSPRGPKFLLSWTSAWKKVRPNSSFCHTSCFLEPQKKAGSEMGWLRYDRSRLALMPFGGSLVIFTPFCRMLTGNLSDG